MIRSGLMDNSLSLASYQLHMVPYGSDEVIATCTGFFYEHLDQYYLITNGHNVTRVNPETNTRITNSMAYPIKIKIKLRCIGNSDSERVFYTRDYEFNLYKDDEFIHPNWFIHPKFGYSVDVIAIPVISKQGVPDFVIINPINKFNLDEDIPIEVSDDVYILGFPLSLTGGKSLPIWKKGSIATEPFIDIDGLPKLLVDTATKPGMSGSLVIYKRSGIHNLNSDGTPSFNTTIGTIQGFVGIYSGRLAAKDMLEAQLGIVWKKSVIKEIIEGNVLGDILFQKI